MKAPHSNGRILLQTDMRKGAEVDMSSQLSENKGIHRTSLSHKTIGVVLPGTIALCCVILCPCFYRKRKETAHAVLDKDPSSGNSHISLYFYLKSFKVD